MMVVLTSAACSESEGTHQAAAHATDPSSTVEVPTDGNVTRHTTSGNLQSTFDIGCIDVAQVRNVYSPADLFKGAVACFQSGDDAEGRNLFWFALAYGRFDIARVADETAHQGLDVLKMSSFEGFSEEDRVRISERLGASINAPDEWAPFCQQLRDLGPPAYHPDYMIQHGIRAFQPISAESGNGLVEDFDPEAAWAMVVDEYMRCAAKTDSNVSPAE
ncbi:MAG: hypothetical protein IPK97_21265 [Ahniella sp.]|nr:hypothetical protein [Ahniella sp.]